jgi:phosphoglycerate dehydrogenase-like enzyme
VVARPARLLLTIPATPATRAIVEQKLPMIPRVYADETTPAEWSTVEAILADSMRRIRDKLPSVTWPRLKFVQTIYTGLDGFPMELFPSTVMIAGNVGGYAPFVAEHGVALLLATAKSFPVANEQARAGTLRPAPTNRMLYQKTAVVLGFGEIGRRIAQRLRPFGMRIVAVTRTGAPEREADETLSAARLADAMALGDVVIDARPLTRTTRHSIGSQELHRTKPDAIYVNVGRAETADPIAIAEHLRTHPEFRVAMDAWWGEDFVGGKILPPFAVAELPNLYGTPHNAGHGAGVAEYALSLALDNVTRFFRGETPKFVVDRAEYTA